MGGLSELSVIAVDLFFSGVVALLGILLWSLTRQAAWMLVIVGLVVHFGDVAFQMLERFGIISVVEMRALGIPFFWVILRALPLLFIGAGIVSMIRSLRI